MTMTTTMTSPRAARRPPPPLLGGLDVYLREIDRTPLLTADEEVALAHRARAGDREAADRMVTSNLRLVVDVARRYVGRGLAMDDLIQSGNCGLIRAVEMFDPARGCRFSTYAFPWLRQAIVRAIADTARPIRTPAYMVHRISLWRRAAAKLRDSTGRDPSPAEVARSLGLDDARAALVLAALATAAVGHRAGPADGPDLLGQLPDPSTIDRDQPDPEALPATLAALDRLPARQAEVVRRRFGLGGRATETLREVGDALGVTKERVRQLESEALAALRLALAGHDPGAEPVVDRPRPAATPPIARPTSPPGLLAALPPLPRDPFAADPGRRPLSPGDRATLAGIVHQAGGGSAKARDYDRRAIARRFADRTGRVVHPDLIDRMLWEECGVRFGAYLFGGAGGAKSVACAQMI